MWMTLSWQPPAFFRSQLCKGGFVVALGGVILLIPALINGFPFVFPDSADYLLLNYYLIFRSAYYGIFLHLFLVDLSVWIPIFAQAMIVSHIIYTTLRLYTSGRHFHLFIVCICFLSLFSSLSFVTAFILADVFTSVMILAIYLLSFHFDRLSFMERVYFFLLLCLSIAVHLSHLAIALVEFMVVAFVFFFYGRPFSSIRLPLVLVAGAMSLGASAILLQNAVLHHTIALSPAGPAFLLANMIQYGPARRYLEESCPGSGYKICTEIKNLPKTSEEVLFVTYKKLGGFEGMRSEASNIVVETIRSRPREVVDMVGAVFANAIAKRVPGVELTPLPLPNASFMEDALRKKFGNATLHAYLASAQNRNMIPQHLLRSVDAIMFPVSLMFVAGAVVVSAWFRWEKTFVMCFVILASVVANTVVCSVTSGAFDRFQSRVTWLLPFLMLLLVGRLLEEVVGGER